MMASSFKSKMNKNVEGSGIKKKIDLDKSFDRKLTLDKITKKVQFIYVPTIITMRRLIFKALKPKKAT